MEWLITLQIDLFDADRTKGFLFCVCVCVCVCFLGPHPWHMEVPRLGFILELYPPAYTTATAMQDLSRICNLHHS